MAVSENINRGTERRVVNSLIEGNNKGMKVVSRAGAKDNPTEIEFYEGDPNGDGVLTHRLTVTLDGNGDVQTSFMKRVIK